MKHCENAARGRRRGFTVAEVVIAMLLMSFLVVLAVSLINLASVGVVGTEIQTTIVREDSAFAAKLNEALRESTVSFTIPKESFNDTSKLTANWNYLGLMDDVHIPKSCSRTGSEIDSAQALVYIEYAGKTAPSSVPKDCNLLSNSDGYFYQKILGHAFTDVNGINHAYSLVFKPTDPTNTAAQTIKYDFSSEVTYASGVPVGTGKDVEIDTMLNCLNAIQVVYKGSDSNPSVALAFRSDFMPTWASSQTVKTPTKTTVVMILDTSSSMSENQISGRERIDVLKERTVELIRELSKEKMVNIIVVPFAHSAGHNNSWGKYTYKAEDDMNVLISRINRLKTGGSTNLGDGMRYAYHELGKMKKEDIGSVVLVMMTDGGMNMCSYTKKVGGGFYFGNLFYRSRDDFRLSRIYPQGERKPARDYAKKMGEKWTSGFTLSKTYLISLDNGMTQEDKDVLTGVFKEEVIDIKSLAEFKKVFEQIGTDIAEVMWAFEGPKL